MSACHFLPFDYKDVYRNVEFEKVKFGESCAIIGDENFLKSSLLFQTALSIANAGDLVFFICPRPFFRCPYHVLGTTESSQPLLQRIKMVYIEKPCDLLPYLCEFHTKESFPAAIIIDDIHYYVSHLPQTSMSLKKAFLELCLSVPWNTMTQKWTKMAFVTQLWFLLDLDEIHEDQSREAAIVKLFAILEDTAAFISQKKGETCHRMVSLLKDMCPKNFLKKYFRERWHVSNGEKQDEYFLTDWQVPALRAMFRLNEEEKIVLQKLFRLPLENEPGAD